MTQYNWDLTKMYKTVSDLSEDMERVKKILDNLNNLKNNFKANFKEVFLGIEEASRVISNIFSYSSMNQDSDSRVSESQKLYLQAEDLYNSFSATISFFQPELLSLEEEEVDTLIKENDLENYRTYIDRIYRYKEHTMSTEEERIFSEMESLASSPSNTFYYLTNADMVFPQIKSKSNERLTNANYVNMLMDPEEEVRKEAFEAMYQTYGWVDNTLASMYYSNVRALVTEARLRSFDSARQMELYKDDVDVKVYDNMVEAVRNNLDSHKKYYELKGKYLGLDQQHMYDVYLPVTKSSFGDIGFEEAKNLIIESLRPLGDDYLDIIKEAFSNNWIDVYPREGKRSGAYSSGTYDSDPYILMNYTDDFDSMFTLTHELGHSVHSYYSRKNNEYIYSNYTIFVAEVASTTNELLLLNYLMDRAESKEDKLYLVNHYLDSFKSTVFRQTMFAEFEKIVHEKVEEGEVLNLEALNEIYYQLNLDYFDGPIEVDKDIELEWARIPHFYRNFYVYKYATGFSTAVKLAENILSGDEEKIKAYKEFLKDGSRNFPIEQLRAAGADITDKETLEDAMGVFRDLVEHFENLI